MDKIKFALQGIPISRSALGENSTIHGFERTDKLAGHERGLSHFFVYHLNGAEAVKIFAVKCAKQDVRIKSIEANLPKLLYGHNGRLIKTSHELFHSLTILRHIVGQIVPDRMKRYILPDPSNPKNLAYISRVECAWHVPDRGQTLLLASHNARYPRLKKKPLVVAGESTTFRGSTFSLTLYDKLAQAKMEAPKDPAEYWIRVEARFTKPDRLHRLHFSPEHDNPAAIKTLTLNDAYHLLRLELGRVDGLWGGTGIMVDSPEWEQAGKMARLMAFLVVSDRVTMHSMLERYRQAASPSDKTFNRTKLELNRLVAGASTLDIENYLPVAMPAAPPEICNTEVEQAREDTAEMWQWPTKPDPDIVKAWSTTTETVPRPSAEDRFAVPATGYKRGTPGLF